MKKPAKAIVLAAGYGTRMAPLSSDLPKPLMPFWGRPLIDRTLQMLATWGVTEVLVNTHHGTSELIRHLRSNPCGPRVNISFEPEILGTGGVLRSASWFLDDSDFWIVNTDIAVSVASVPFTRRMARGDCVAALWMHEDEGPRTVELSEGLVTNFRSDRPGAEGTATFCGLQLVSNRVFKYLPRSTFFSLVDVYERAMDAGEKVAGVLVENCFWADTGTPGSYVRAHGRALERRKKKMPGGDLVDPGMMKRARSMSRSGVRITGFAAVAHGASVRPGAEIENSVIWDGAVIGPRAVLRGAIAGRESSVEGRVDRIAQRATLLGEDSVERQAIRALGWPERRVMVMPLQPRGSDRAFTRLGCGRKQAMLVVYGTERVENERFAQHALFLRDAGIPVPGILLDKPRSRFVVVEDVGYTSLEMRKAACTERSLEAVYRRVIDAASKMHGIRTARLRHIPLEPAFDADLYAWERELMAEHCLYAMFDLRGRTVSGILADLEQVAIIMLGERRVLVHRDLQSSNIMVRRGHPIFIDFQGMRLGPASYDIASLLCDPYVMLPEDLQMRLLFHYVNCPSSGNIRQVFWYAALQRLSQALGAYGRLARQPGTGRFLGYVKPALLMMKRALSHVDGLPELRAFVMTNAP